MQFIGKEIDTPYACNAWSTTRNKLPYDAEYKCMRAHFCREAYNKFRGVKSQVTFDLSCCQHVFDMSDSNAMHKNHFYNIY